MSTTQTLQVVPTGTWQADPVHSDIAFAVDYMAGTFRGSFSRFAADVADGRLSGWADVASVQVKDPNLEAHLKSPEFFDAERHARLTFESHEISGSDGAVAIRGEITIKGHTEPIELTGTFTEPAPDPYGNERFGLRIEATLDRTDFGLNWNAPLPTGQPALSNEVRLVADLQFVESS